jgi:probable blue pigment (indigoidine) exporter
MMRRLMILLMAALPPAIWGSTYLVTTEMLPADRPMTAAVLRLLPVGLLIVLLTRCRPAPGQWWKLLILSALCMSGLHGLLFVAAYRLPGGLAALLVCAQPLIVLVLGFLLFAQRTPLRVCAAAAVGFAGVALVLLSPTLLRWDFIGAVAALLAAASMGLGTLLVKRWGMQMPVLAFTGWQLLLGGLLLVPLAVFMEWPLPALEVKNVAGYAYLAIIGTLIPYLLWFRALRELEPVLISIFLLLSPLSALALGYLFLGQTLTVWQAVGAVAVFAGILLSQLPARAR